MRLSILSALAALLFACNVSNTERNGSTEPLHDYPPEAAVSYTRPFSAGTTREVCSSDADAYRLLTSSTGACYVLSPRQDAGAFGSFHYAIDSYGMLWAVKKIGDQGHAGTEERALRRELGLWEHLGRGVEVRDVLRDETAGCTFIVMTLMDGNVGSAVLQVSDRVQLARGVIRQVASDAAELHDLGFVHHDIRLPNIFWQQSGRVVLADYGLARHVEEDGLLERAPWQIAVDHNVGVIVGEAVAAPEVKHSRYDAHTDSWSLAIASLQAMMPDHPLVGHLMTELFLNNIGYADWRRTLIDHRGQVDLACIVDPRFQSVPPRHFLFHAFFFAAKQMDGALTQLILQHLLVVDPAERWTAAQLREATAHEGTTEADLAPVLGRVAAANADRQRALESLRACADTVQLAGVCEGNERP